MQPIKTPTINTTCPYCGVGCGVTVTPGNSSEVTIAGDQTHPANRGNLCLKGQTLTETVSAGNRLLYPTAFGEKSSWDNALSLIAKRFSACIEQYGPESIAFYVSGQLLTEDYYVVNKFVKGYLGTANIDTNSRLCMASSVAGHKRAFGADTVPGCYEDLETADLIVLVGSNLAWCHPVLFNRIETARQTRPALKVINIDPRSTATANLADSHLNIRPDSDTALFNGLLHWLVQNECADHHYIETATSGLEHVLEAVQSMDVKTVALLTGLNEAQIALFYRQFAACERVVTVYSQGVNQSSGGTDKVNSIINCHLVTGRIGKPGCGPFSITGQPNAMGGRETGGLANTLTCHMELDNPTHRELVQTYWQSPHMANSPGLTAVDLFNAVHDRRIKALWIMATNPMVSMPDSNFVAEALNRCDFVIQSDVVVDNDTSAYAHVRLPAHAWGEKDGTVTNSERCISRQRRFLAPPAQTRADWQAVAGVAAKLGYGSSFNYQSPHEIFAEYAELSGVKNNGSRDFDISIYRNICADRYENLNPFYWPAVEQSHDKPVRFFADGNFFTNDNRARFIVTQPLQQPGVAQGMLSLNTGRTRDQWHTMTRTGSAHTLANHTAEPYMEIQSADAEARQLATADLVNIHNDNGECTVRVIVSDTVTPGSIFIPMHWCAPFTGNGKVNALTQRITDPVSRQPALKSGLVFVEKLNFSHYGFIVTRHTVDTTPFDYYAKARCNGGWRYEFAVKQQYETATDARALLQSIGDEVVVLKTSSGRYGHFSFTGQSLQTAMIMDNSPVVASRNWLAGQLTEVHTLDNRNRLLAAIQSHDQHSSGELICHCMGVGSKQIDKCIKQQGCRTLFDVGKATGAGTNCGSCRSEIAAILKNANTLQPV